MSTYHITICYETPMIFIGDGPKQPITFVEIDNKDCGCCVVTGYSRKPRGLSMTSEEIVDAQYCTSHSPKIGNTPK